MKRAILFDLDGTLLDTTEGVLESASFAARGMGLPSLPHDTMLRFVGPPIQESFQTHYGLSVEEAQRAANSFREYYKSKALLKACPYFGMVEVLGELVKRGCKIGVATYKREDYALTILQHFGIAKFCQSMHGADNFNQLTKADIVELCLRELGEEKRDSVLVGDTVHDAKGAAVAQVDFIGVTFGFGFRSRAEISPYPSYACIDSLTELLEVI